MKKEDLYFEKHDELVPTAKEFFKRVFFYTGVEDADEYTIKRCINELGKFVTKAKSKTDLKRSDDEVLFTVKKAKDELLNKHTHPVYILEPRPIEAHKKSLDAFFYDYKERFNMTNSDFGWESDKKRSPKYVFNKAMFSRFAYSCGYDISQISRLMKCDRTTIIHYIRRYKTHKVNEEYITKTL